MTIKIKNWSSYQSYKDRKPPWVRLHRTLLDNYDFQKMSDSSRALLPMLWLIASEDVDPKSGLIRKSYEDITFRLRLDFKAFKLALQEISKHNFIELIKDEQNQSCSDSVTSPYLNRNQTVPPETETETETEKRQRREEQTPPAKLDVEHEEIKFWESLKENAAYKHINLDVEKGKMSAWLSLPKNKSRHMTKQFVLNWLNKIDRPMTVESGYDEALEMGKAKYEKLKQDRARINA